MALVLALASVVECAPALMVPLVKMTCVPQQAGSVWVQAQGLGACTACWASLRHDLTHVKRAGRTRGWAHSQRADAWVCAQQGWACTS